MERSEILALLGILAEQTKEQVSQERLAYMVIELRDIADEKLNRALRQLIREARRFPTIAEIEEAAGLGGVSELSKAVDAAGRIEAALVSPSKRSREAMGDLAWLVAERMGGLNHLCEIVTNDDLGTYRAHFRQMALSLQESSRCGELDLAPGLPPGPVGDAIAGLADRLSIGPTKERR